MTFDKYLRTLLEQASHEARAEGAATIEAQHLLLAMASPSDTELGPFLRQQGLDPGAIRAALSQELERALGTAGVVLGLSGHPREDALPDPTGHLGVSVQHALERGLEGLRSAPRPAHVLLGILRAEVGTVPRALALAGFDRGLLIGQVQQTLGVPR